MLVHVVTQFYKFIGFSRAVKKEDILLKIVWPRAAVIRRVRIVRSPVSALFRRAFTRVRAASGVQICTNTGA